MDIDQAGIPLPRATGIIVAGGASRRMGRDKAFVELQGKPLVERVIERVRSVCTETIIVANNKEAFARFGLPVVGDVYRDKGSLGGIYSGLKAAREPYVLAVACDMPFLNEALLRYLISLAPGFDVVIPRAPDPSSEFFPASATTSRPRMDRVTARQRNLHPLHAIYAKSCLEPIQGRLETDDLRVISFIETTRVRVVEADEIDQIDPGHLSFFNVNTPENLRTALDLVDQ